MRPSLLPSLLLVLLTAFAFWPARTADFSIYDDPLHVTGNPYILPPTPARIAYFWRYPLDRSPVPGVPSTAGGTVPPYEQIYSPLAFTVWGLLVYPSRIAPEGTTDDPLTQSVRDASFSLDAAIYHSFNLGLHVLNVLLVFALLRRFVKREWAAALGAALFAVHPVQVEPVAWITGMNNLLSGLFALAALLFYLQNKDASEKPRWREFSYWAATLCFLFSLLSKPSSATLPALALILCWGIGETRWRARALEMMPWAGLAVLCVVMNRLTQKGLDYGLESIWWQKPFVIGDALTFYGSKLVFPWQLAPDYGRRPEWVMEQPLTYFIWLIPFFIGVGFWLWWRRSVKRGRESFPARMAIVAFALFVMVLLPSSGLVTYYFHRISTVADRYMYMALLGPALLLAALAAATFEIDRLAVRRFLTLGGAALLGAAAFLSFQQSKLWQNDLLLWSHNIAVNPQSRVAYYAYGSALQSKRNYQASIEAYTKGLRFLPNDWLIHVAIATSYNRLKQYPKAEYHYRRSLELSPTAANARLGLGILLSRQGKIEEAVEQLGRGLEVRPEDPILLANMGVNVAKLGHNEAGAIFLRDALKHGFNPAAGHLYLGIALGREGKIEEAMKEWNLSLRLDPNFYETHFNLGIAAVKRGDTDTAIQFFGRTVQLKPDYAPAHVQLGLQLQKQERNREAKEAFRAALKLDPDNELALKAIKAMK